MTAQATERLPDGLVAPSLTTPNLTDKAAVAAAVQRVLRAVGVSRGRVAVVIPDGAAKVSVVRFEKVPAKAEDLAQLVRWQVRKSVPFPIEQSQVSWTPGVTDASGTDYVVTVARQDIVQDYEQAVAAAGVQVGLVDLATFNLVNLLLAGDAAGTARRLAAGPRHARRQHDGDRPRRRAAAVPAPAGRGRGQPVRSRPPDRDVLRRSPRRPRPVARRDRRPRRRAGRPRRPAGPRPRHRAARRQGRRGDRSAGAGAGRGRERHAGERAAIAAPVGVLLRERVR